MIIVKIGLKSDKWQWHLAEYKKRIGYLAKQMCQLQVCVKEKSHRVRKNVSHQKKSQ